MASVPQAAQRQQSLSSYTRPASICGSFIGSKRALLAFTWTVTTLLTFVGFFVAVVFVMRIQSHYRYLNRLYASDDDYGNQQQEGGEGEDEHNSEDYRNQQLYPLLSSTSSAGVTFVGLWMMFLSVALTLYGSTAIVGFTSFQGVYIAPCFASRNQMKVGIFGGAIVVFANMLLLCAVLFGEVWVSSSCMTLNRRRAVLSWFLSGTRLFQRECHELQGTARHDTTRHFVFLLVATFACMFVHVCVCISMQESFVPDPTWFAWILFQRFIVSIDVISLSLFSLPTLYRSKTTAKAGNEKKRNR